MRLFALLKEKVGFSSMNGSQLVATASPASRDYTPCEIDLIVQELHSNNQFAEEAGRRRGIAIDPKVAAANLR